MQPVEGKEMSIIIMKCILMTCVLMTCRYVLRRILRRGVRYCAEKLNGRPGTFASLVPTVVDILVSVFEERDLVINIIIL